MKKVILLFGFLIAVVVLSGCAQESGTETVYKYVCSDGNVVDSPASCPTPDVNCDKWRDACLITQDQNQQLTEGYIQGEIDNANYCATKDDCALTIRKCPFGCYVFVNKNELDRIDELLDAYRPTCVLSCPPMDEYICENGACKYIVYGENP